MSSWIDKAKDFIKGNPDKARDALEKAEDVASERTGGAYAEYIDQSSDLVSEKLGLPPETEVTPAPVPAPEPAPDPAPGPAPSGGATPDLPSDGGTTLGDPPPAAPSR
ncbi:antitoxin [Intrasporangium sp.]|uniref:antitoxin n=1 Tax=Intrasporangium sp. TaxID=1925024 RepID=UPI0033654360